MLLYIMTIGITFAIACTIAGVKYAGWMWKDMSNPHDGWTDTMH